jgi:hypothetical protein
MGSIPTSPFQFMIDQVFGRVYCQNIPVACTFPVLAPNINQVSFLNGTGAITYNDRSFMPEVFRDPSPYQPQINSWMTAMQSATIPITLAQAILVKLAYVAAVYDIKRQNAVHVNTTAGNLFWDASDTAMGQYTMLAPYTANIAAAISTISTALSATMTLLNNTISVLISNESTGNALIPQYNALVAALNLVVGNGGGGGVTQLEVAFDQYTAFVQMQSGEALSPANPLRCTLPATQPTFGATFAGAGGSVTWTPPSVTSPSFNLIPFGASTSVTLTAADVAAIMAAINAQQLTEQAVLFAKQAQINALTTVPAVIAYDVTIGW